MNEEQKMPYEAHKAVEYVTKLVSDYESKITSLNNQIAFLTNVPKNKPLTPQNFRSIKFKEEKYDSWSGKHRVTYLLAADDVEKLKAEDTKIFEANKAIIAENIVSANTLKKIIEGLGLPTTKEVQVKNGRHGYKRVNQTCDWINQIDKLFDISQSSYEYDYNNIIRELKDYEQKTANELRQKEDEAQKIKKEQDYKILLISLVKKYDLPESVVFESADEVADAIASKNKYLYLARYLAKNRGDWNDGCSYAETGMHNFTVTNGSTIDKEISEQIYSLINNWDGDGRVFRDCEWSYDKLFSMVEKQSPELYADYMKMYEFEINY